MLVKELDGYPGYLISENGDVFSQRTRNCKIDCNKMVALRHDITNKGYARVTVCVDGKVSRHSIHRLVAANFLSNPKEGQHLVRTWNSLHLQTVCRSRVSSQTDPYTLASFYQT